MLKNYLKDKKTVIDHRLAQLVHTEVPAFGTLYKSMNYSLLQGGKRIRPILMIAVLEALGRDSTVYLDIGCALECVHTYSLIHDDLPAMDDDRYRRGNLTNHVVFGDGMAILAGDGLLTFAFDLISRQPVEASKLVEIVRILSKAAGPAGMVGGQAYDLESEGNLSIGLDGLQLMHRAKTGEIFKAAIDIAAVLGEAAPEQRAALEEYAVQLGLTFQITDDILDVTGDEKTLGKPVGSDEKNHKATYVTIFSLEEARQMAREAVDKAVAALEPLGDRAVVLKDLVNYLLVRAN